MDTKVGCNVFHEWSFALHFESNCIPCKQMSNPTSLKIKSNSV